MLDAPLPDPMGELIVEVRSDPDVAALVVDRVRGLRPAPGDAQPRGSYRAFVVLAALDAPPDPRIPVVRASYSAACYGATAQGAWAVWAAVAKAEHRRGLRTTRAGVGIWDSYASGGSEDEDPDTQQPVVRGVIELVYASRLVGQGG